ncbi:MAG TPA: response regulator [Bryobacteraceae bacterium]|nr:response regulator [Bryobacteraceae bacterium]
MVQYILNLLLAEDNLPDALLVREAIQAEQLEVYVHIVADGELAIDFIARAARVMLLDLNLPKVDGVEVLRRVRAIEKFKSIPVIIVTSSDSPGDRSAAAKLGASYFRKPVSYQQFIKIGGILRSFLKENSLL